MHSQNRSVTLTQRSVSKEQRRLCELVVFNVTRYADHLEVLPVRVHAQALTDGIAVRSQATCQCLVHDNYGSTRCSIAIIKISPTDQRNAEGLEVIGSNRSVLDQRTLIEVRGDGFAFHVER